jgi:hypothetical protein
LHRLCGLPPSVGWLALPLRPQGTPWPPWLIPLLQTLLYEGRKYGAFFILVPEPQQPTREGR